MRVVGICNVNKGTVRFEEHAGCALSPILLKVVGSCSLLSEHFVTVAHETSSCRCGVASDELPSGRSGFPLANPATACREKVRRFNTRIRAWHTTLGRFS